MIIGKRFAHQITQTIVTRFVSTLSLPHVVERVRAQEAGPAKEWTMPIMISADGAAFLTVARLPPPRAAHLELSRPFRKWRRVDLGARRVASVSASRLALGLSSMANRPLHVSFRPAWRAPSQPSSSPHSPPPILRLLRLALRQAKSWCLRQGWVRLGSRSAPVLEVAVEPVNRRFLGAGRTAPMPRQNSEMAWCRRSSSCAASPCARPVSRP